MSEHRLEDLQSERTMLRRLPERGRHDRATVHAVLDAAPVCHLGYADGTGQPFVVPTVHARVDDVVYVHGSAASRTLRTLRAGIPVCLTATLLDGVVLARSAFHHSVNYRSVMVLGTATAVDDPDEKRRALDAIVDHLTPGRSTEARPPTESELRATLVLRLHLVEASAKVRTGGPVDEADDLALPVWAGVVPLRTVAGPPEPDPACSHPLPRSLTALSG